MWLGMSKEAKDLILLAAVILFLLMSEVTATTVFAIACGLMYLKEWEKD